MAKNHLKRLIVISIVLAFFLTGCMGMQGRGRLDQATAGGDGVTIQGLTNDWQDYDVYFSGNYAESATSVVFDPKSDAKGIRLTGRNWTKIGDNSTLNTAVRGIMVSTDFSPHVWNVLGPDNASHGYIYTGWRLVSVHAIDENNVSIEGLPAAADRKHHL